ncbi:MAG TPA: cytochrome c [Steroidobacteraceae bacterium]
MSTKTVWLVRLAVWALAALVAPFARPADVPPHLTMIANRGQYLATAGNCGSCHTAPGGQPFAGGRPIDTPFGVIYTSNITPDPETGIGNWTEQDLAKAMREGTRPDGQHLYPAFPYTAFTKLSDEDIGLLYAYLKTLTPIKVTPTPNTLSFPFNQRSLMSVWNALFFKPGRFVADPSKPADWNRGAYLVEGLGHCGACHTPRNLLGAEKLDMALTGGTYVDVVPGGEMKSWSTVNLTSASTGLGTWSINAIAAYLQTGHNARAVTFGPMNNVVMPSTRNLSTADIKAIAVYLKSLPPKETSATPASKEALKADEVVYNLRCGTCHEPTGLGSDAIGPPLVGSAIVQAPDPSSLINTIIYGTQLPEPPIKLSYNKDMTSMGDDMTDQDIAKVCTYVRGNWGNRAGSVDEAQVAKQR